MNQPVFEFNFEGPDAADDAQALAVFLEQELPDWPARVGPSQSPPKRPGTRDAGTTLSIIALALSLPGVAKNALDLAERSKLQQKFERLIAWAKQRRAGRLDVPVVIIPPHRTPVRLDQVKPEQLLAAVPAQMPPSLQKS